MGKYPNGEDDPFGRIESGRDRRRRPTVSWVLLVRVMAEIGLGFLSHLAFNDWHLEEDPVTVVLPDLGDFETMSPPESIEPDLPAGLSVDVDVCGPFDSTHPVAVVVVENEGVEATTGLEVIVRFASPEGEVVKSGALVAPIRPSESVEAEIMGEWANPGRGVLLVDCSVVSVG